MTEAVDNPDQPNFRRRTLPQEGFERLVQLVNDPLSPTEELKLLMSKTGDEG